MQSQSVMQDYCVSSSTARDVVFYGGGDKTLAFSKGCDLCWRGGGLASWSLFFPPGTVWVATSPPVLRQQDGRSQRRPWSRATSLMSAWGRMEALTPPEFIAAKAEEAEEAWHAKRCRQIRPESRRSFIWRTSEERRRSCRGGSSIWLNEA